jgi:hypothetical protein
MGSSCCGTFVAGRVWGLESFAQYSIQRQLGKLGHNLECFLNNVTIKPCKMGMKSIIVLWVILDLSSPIVLLPCYIRVSVSVGVVDITMQVSVEDAVVAQL